MVVAMLDDLLGRRVSLRHRIAPDDAPGPRFTDAVGELTSGGPDTVLVRTRSGEVRVRRDAVVAVRAVPAAPPRRASRAAIAHLERLRSAAWPAPVREQLGGWTLRAAPGFANNRANSVLVEGDPGAPIDAALARVRAFADEYGIAPQLQLPVGSPWTRRLADAGWVPADPPGECLVLVTTLPDTRPDDAEVPDWPSTPPAGWWSVFDDPVPDDDTAVRAVVAPVLRSGEQSRTPSSEGVLRRGEQSKAHPEPGPPGPGDQSPAAPAKIGFGLLHVDDSPAATARATVVEDHLYVARLAVRPEFRRRGLADALMRDALVWGRARGARHAMLDVTADNDAARALYARDGWTEHHRYQYLRPAQG
ncbi:GNAT family N-acetyltransferase [Pseudonocardia phyllosphaerae]|uniref:GNAT family N-acetyltransferase n=1 Tax=Pseudonocardia phyllosphaerae TaxID=3390502 RepID=UPI00397B73CF